MRMEIMNEVEALTENQNQRPLIMTEAHLVHWLWRKHTAAPYGHYRLGGALHEHVNTKRQTIKPA